MGYDVGRFQGDVDEDLICPICSGVLEEPVQVGVAYRLLKRLCSGGHDWRAGGLLWHFCLGATLPSHAAEQARYALEQ